MEDNEQAESDVASAHSNTDNKLSSTENVEYFINKMVGLKNEEMEKNMDIDDKEGDIAISSTRDIASRAHNKVSFDGLKTLLSCETFAQITCIALDGESNL